MANRPNLLETEKALQELLEILSNIKSASEQVDELKSSSLVIQESSEELVTKMGKMVANVGEVAEASSRVVAEIESADIAGRLELLLNAIETFYDEFQSRDRRANTLRSVFVVLLLIVLLIEIFQIILP